MPFFTAEARRARRLRWRGRGGRWERSVDVEETALAVLGDEYGPIKSDAGNGGFDPASRCLLERSALQPEAMPMVGRVEKVRRASWAVECRGGWWGLCAILHLHWSGATQPGNACRRQDLGCHSFVIRVVADEVEIVGVYPEHGSVFVGVKEGVVEAGEVGNVGAFHAALKGAVALVDTRHEGVDRCGEVDYQGGGWDLVGEGFVDLVEEV